MKNFLNLVILLFPFLASCQPGSVDPPLPENPQPPYAWNQFSMGVDLSYVNEIEAFGGNYSAGGSVGDPFIILKNCGANTVRVRLWHNPTWVSGLTGGKIYSDLADVERTIRRAKNAGMAASLDFHYSDTWADPDHQEAPEAWAGLDLATLKDSVYQYTLKVLQYLESKNLTPEMVQVGNETNNGMVFPQGQVVNDNYVPFGTLLNAGIKAVRDFSKTSAIKPKIILHVAQMQNAEWWIKNVVTKGKVTDFDFLGISHYAKWSTVSRMDVITSIIREIRTTYGKQVMIVETAYPWTGEDADNYKNIVAFTDSVPGYPVSQEGQTKYLHDLTQAVIKGGGMGIHYWEPAWITSRMRDKWGTGSSWDNCTLFGFSGELLPSANNFKAQYQFTK